MTTTVDGVEVSGMTVPAGSSPGSGTCPSVQVIIGPGAKIEVPEGSTWSSTASVSGFDQVDETGGHWTCTVTDSEGEIPAGTYVGPTSFSYGGSASIEWTYIPGKTTPVDPTKPPVNPPDNPPDDPSKPPTTLPVNPPGTTIPIFGNSVNPDPEFGKTDPYPFSKYSKTAILLEHYIDVGKNGSFVRNPWNNDGFGELIIHWRDEPLQNSNSMDSSKYTLPRARIYAKGSYGQTQNQELRSIGAKRTDNIQVYIGASQDMNFANTPQKILARFHIGSDESDFNGDTITFWTYKGDPASRNTKSRSASANTYAEGPIYDLGYYMKQSPNGTNGVVRVRALNGVYKQGVYEMAMVSRTRKLGDIVWDGTLNHEDVELAYACQGFTNSVADVAGKDEILGRPDGKVDMHDPNAISKVIPAGERAKIVPPAAVKGTSYWANDFSALSQAMPVFRDAEKHRDYSGTTGLTRADLSLSTLPEPSRP